MAYLVYLWNIKEEHREQLSAAMHGSEFQLDEISSLEEFEKNLYSRPATAIIMDVSTAIQFKAHLKQWQPLKIISIGAPLTYYQSEELYEAGLYRHFPWDDKTAEMIGDYLRMLQFRETENRLRMQRRITQGAMEDFDLVELLKQATREKRNLVLKIYTQNWIAKMRIFQGEIVEAVAGRLNGVSAVLAMLALQEGIFRLRTYEKDSELIQNMASPLALILEANYEQKLIREMFHTLGEQNPELSVNYKLGRQEAKTDLIEFLEFVQKQGHLKQILQLSPLPVLTTIRLLEGLFRKRIVHLKSLEGQESFFNPTQVQLIKNSYFKDNEPRKRVVVLAPDEDSLHAILSGIIRGSLATIKKKQSVLLTNLSIDDHHQLSLFGIPTSAYFQPIIGKLSENLIGCIFIFGELQEERIEYMRYLMRQMMQGMSCPVVFGILGSDTSEESQLFDIRKKLEIPAEIPFTLVDPENTLTLRQLFLNLANRVSESQNPEA